MGFEASFLPPCHRARTLNCAATGWPDALTTRNAEVSRKPKPTGKGTPELNTSPLRPMPLYSLTLKAMEVTEEIGVGVGLGVTRFFTKVAMHVLDEPSFKEPSAQSASPLHAL